MTGVRRLALLVAAMMLVTASIAYIAKPTVHLADRIGKPNLETLFPAVFDGWTIDASLPIILAAPDVQSKLDAIYNQVLSRTYVNSHGDRIMLSVAYGGDQSDGTRAHRPEICYPVQGFQITFNQKGTMAVVDRTIQTRQLMSSMGMRKEPITYWLVVGGEAVTSGAEQKFVELRYGLRGMIPDGMLIRISSIDPDMRHGFSLHAEFSAAMAKSMPEASRDRVFGRPQASRI
jgi:EpsI family protein